VAQSPLDFRREQGRRRLKDGFEFASRQVSAFLEANGITPPVAEARLRHMRQLIGRPRLEDFAAGVGDRENRINEEFLLGINGDPITHVLGNLLHRTVSFRLDPVSRIWAREEVQSVDEALQKARREIATRIAGGESFQGIAWQLEMEAIRSDTGERERIAVSLTRSQVEQLGQQMMTLDHRRCAARIGPPPPSHQDMSRGAYVRALGNLSDLYDYGRFVFGPERGLRVAALFVEEEWEMSAPFSRKELKSTRERHRRHDAAGLSSLSSRGGNNAPDRVL
jgi:hypothetical protein